MAVIIGAGYIAVEFAGIFQGYGADVKLLCRGDKILRGFEEDCRDFVQAELTKKGLDLRLQTEVESVVQQTDGKRLKVTLNTGEVLGDVDVVMCATGRTAKLDGLGLESCGVEVQNGLIKVNKWQQTSCPSIYAIGDCSNTMELTPVALAEGHCFADTQFGGNPRTADLEDVATAVFCQPSLAQCGLTEAAAVEKYGHVKVFKSDFKPMKGTLSGSTERNFMKMIVDGKSDRVVGVHIVGHGSAEMMQGIAVAMKCNATKAQFDATIGIHPTSAEEFVTMRTMSYEVGAPQQAANL